MEIRSLAYRTDLIFPRFEGEVEDQGDCIVVRTPSNPTFYWGNFLLFAQPPGPGDKKRWMQRFAATIGTPPAIRHFAFGWDAPDGATGAIEPFLAAGFDLDETVVLTAREVHLPPRYCAEAVIRPLNDNDAEWEEATENQIASRHEQFTDAESYRVYKQRQMARYRRMVRAGQGTWFGAFLDNRLVGDCGVFHDGTAPGPDRVARFQQVGVAPDYRRRGVCGAMVYQAARYALEQMQAGTLVMVADAHYHAARIYESVGFRPTQRQASLTWWEHR